MRAANASSPANGKPRFSPSVLNDFLECEHLVALELRGTARPERDNPQADLIRRKGEEHERAHLDELLAAGKEIVTIEVAGPDGKWDTEAAAARAERAMRQGADVIYQ